jgi:serine/alanine adding enzyme
VERLASSRVTPAACAEVEPERWDDELRAAGVTDVYYSRGFVAASAALADAEPVLLRLAGERGDVFLACLLRRDPVDVVTPYGYGGPVGAGDAPPLAAFPAAYEAWCERRGVVSSFVVFHPLLGNARSEAAARFHRTPLAGTVAWRLEAPDLLAAMHKHHRRLVRRAQAAGYDVAIEPRPRSLDEFVAVYEQTMRRAGAAPFYLFPPGYWQALASGVPIVRVDVRSGGELLASVLGMGEPPWLHYHLGGAADAARGTGASHLALYRLACWGRDQGYDTLHLGGGVGGRDDSLLEYKLRFAPGGRTGAAIGKAVHDRATYLRLTGAAEIDWDGFFPAYREQR